MMIMADFHRIFTQTTVIIIMHFCVQLPWNFWLYSQMRGNPSKIFLKSYLLSIFPRFSFQLSSSPFLLSKHLPNNSRINFQHPFGSHFSTMGDPFPFRSRSLQAFSWWSSLERRAWCCRCWRTRGAWCAFCPRSNETSCSTAPGMWGPSGDWDDGMKGASDLGNSKESSIK